MRHKAPIFVCVVALFSSPALANDGFESIAGFHLDQDCTGPGFTKELTKLLNPNNPVDMIEITANRHESLTAGGHSLSVFCSVIDNRVHSISLTAENPQDISDLRASLREKMGRPPDDQKSVDSPPRSFFGITADGIQSELEYWELPGNRRASSHETMVTPYGTSSLSDLKWRGGIGLYQDGSNAAQWEHVKQTGALSSTETEALDEKGRRDAIRSLLD